MESTKFMNELMDRHMPRIHSVVYQHWMLCYTLPKFVLLVTSDYPWASKVATANKLSGVDPVFHFKPESDGSYLIPCNVLPPSIPTEVSERAGQEVADGMIGLIVASGEQCGFASMSIRFSHEAFAKSLPDAAKFAVDFRLRQHGKRSDLVIVIHPDLNATMPNGNKQMGMAAFGFRDIGDSPLASVISIERDLEAMIKRIRTTPPSQLAVVLMFSDSVMLKSIDRPVDARLN